MGPQRWPFYIGQLPHLITRLFYVFIYKKVRVKNDRILTPLSYFFLRFLCFPEIFDSSPAAVSALAEDTPTPLIHADVILKQRMICPATYIFLINIFSIRQGRLF